MRRVRCVNEHSETHKKEKFLKSYHITHSGVESRFKSSMLGIVLHSNFSLVYRSICSWRLNSVLSFFAGNRKLELVSMSCFESSEYLSDGRFLSG